MKKALAIAISAAALALGAAGIAAADSTPDCKDYYPNKVLVAKGDPYDLDRDGDGIGCDSHPGDAVSQTDDTPKREKAAADTEELAETGASDVAQRHPIRSAGVAGALIVAGAIGVAASRRPRRAL